MLCPYDVWDHHILIWYLHTDVAISAPFGVDSGGEALPGTVYIYAGAGADVIRQTPIQVITTLHRIGIILHIFVCLCNSIGLLHLFRS